MTVECGTPGFLETSKDAKKNLYARPVLIIDNDTVDLDPSYHVCVSLSSWSPLLHVYVKKTQSSLDPYVRTYV